MTTPIGGLIIDSEAKAKKKASGYHESTAPCGCMVATSWFSENSRTTHIERCTEHTKRIDA